MPFHTIRIDEWEGKIKRFVSAQDEATVSIEQLQYSFKNLAHWEDLGDTGSTLYRAMTHVRLRDEKQPSRLNVHKMMLLGLILCPGSNDLKARVLYDVLQDNLQKTISANDKDFKITFARHVEIAYCLIIDLCLEINDFSKEDTEHI